VTQTHDNLAKVIETARDRNIMVLLAGMEAPTNLGEDYQEGLHASLSSSRATTTAPSSTCPFCSKGWLDILI
jgi:hypothetical protein